jgi:hypothetical protein
MRCRVGLLIACLLPEALPCVAAAGMPAPLPDDVPVVFRLSDPTTSRLASLSFFVAVLLVCAAVIRWLWNYLRRDFPRLPYLSYGKAVAGVMLWGLLFFIVLTMISGARELMTPGAWKRQGFTYTLATAADESVENAAVLLRRQHLERLRTALWRYAATHGGRFPPRADYTALPAELWEVPDSGGLRYLYAGGLSADESATLLVCEPELEPGRRFALQTNGDLVRLTSRQVAQRFSAEKKP